jgi:hypothetical protein
MMRRGVPGTLASLAILSLPMAGCGEGGESTAAAAKPPQKQEFIATADSLCAEWGEESHAAIARLPAFERIVAPDVSSRLMAAVGRQARRVAAAERGLARELLALTPPASFESRWERAVNAIEARAVAAEDIRAAAEVEDRSAYLAAFDRFVRAGDASTAALRGYGFEACAAG